MPSVSNLYSQGGLSWHPDADVVNAPEGSLLRADNLVPDRDGSMTIRLGSSVVYSSLGTNVHSLYAAELSDGTTYRVTGVDDSIFVNGAIKDSGVAGTGDISFTDDSYQIFMARGTTKKKWHPTDGLVNWSIARPVAAPTLTAVSETTSTVAAFNNTENPAVTVQEGSGTIGGAADADGNANEATELTPDGTSFRGVLKRLWTTDQDYFNIANITGNETDLIDFYVKFENPRSVESITIQFGIDNSSTIPFKDNRFEFVFNIKDGVEVQLKDQKSEGYAAYESAVLKSIAGVNPEEVTGIKTPGQVKNTLSNVGGVPSPKSVAPPENTWSHLTVSRGQFKRIGNDASRGWNTVRGFRIIYKAVKGKTDTLTIADAIVVGGGARCLTGTYRCVFRAVKQVVGPDGNVIYYEKSPPSPQSTAINLNHQALQITIDGTTKEALDPQADQLWVYLFGGWLDSYYRFAVVPASATQGMTIDELTTPAGSDLNSVVERARIPSWGFTYCQLNTSGTPEVTIDNDLTITLRTTELEALTDNIRIEPYQIGCPNKIIDIAGPWNGRIFTLTSDGYVYPSNINDPSSFNSLQVIDLTRYGDPLWLAKTGSGIYAGCEKDVIFLQGDGANSEDLAQINLFPQPLNSGNPPIDKMHWREGNSVIYRSADGLMVMTGGSFEPLPTAGTSLLWRGQERHFISINLSSGRFRCTVDNQMMYALIPEGDDTSSNAIWRYSFEKQQWSRMYFPQVTSWMSIFNEPDGSLVAGDTDGRLWLLESGTDDNGSQIPIAMYYPIEDGGQPFAYKDPMDLQIHFVTGGSPATVNIFKDGETTTSGTYTGSSASEGIFRQQLSSVGKFIKAKVEITGSFNDFRLHKMNITYRIRPQRMVYLDTGYITPDDPSDIIWLQEVEFDANCTEDFTMELYKDDSLYYSVDVSPTTQKRIVNRIPVPRESKGDRLRLVFKSDTTAGSGDVGFDPYGVQVRIRNTGNEDFKPYRTVYPVGEAP